MCLAVAIPPPPPHCPPPAGSPDTEVHLTRTERNTAKRSLTVSAPRDSRHRHSPRTFCCALRGVSGVELRLYATAWAAPSATKKYLPSQMCQNTWGGWRRGSAHCGGGAGVGASRCSSRTRAACVAVCAPSPRRLRVRVPCPWRDVLLESIYLDKLVLFRILNRLTAV